MLFCFHVRHRAHSARSMAHWPSPLTHALLSGWTGVHFGPTLGPLWAHSGSSLGSLGSALAYRKYLHIQE